MAQTNRLLGDLFYDNTPRPFIPPPVKELKELTKARENDYLLAKDTQNEIETALRSVPNSYSPEVYNDLVTKTRQTLSGLNADNYADNVLNVKQIAQDFKNKWGSVELMQQAKDIQDRFAIYDEKGKKGENTPEMIEYYKARTLQESSPVTYDKEGLPVKANVTTIPAASTFNIGEDGVKVSNGWKANTFQRDANGKLIVGNDLPGFFSVGTTEEVKDKDVHDALYKYYSVHPQAQAYLKDYADMRARKLGDSPEALDAVLPQDVKDSLLGVKDANAFDLANAAAQGRLDIPSLLREVIKVDEMEKGISLAVEKEGYTKDTVNLVKNEMLFKALDQMVSNKKTKEETPEDTNAVVSVVPETSVVTFSPTNIKNLNTQKIQLIADRAKAQQEVYKYQSLLKDKSIGADPERLKTLSDRVAEIDRNIERANQQQKGITDALMKQGKEVGVDFMKTYEKDFTSAKQEAVKRNKAKWLNNVDFNVTNNIVTRGNKIFLKEGGKEVDVTGLGLVKQEGNNFYMKYNANPSSNVGTANPSVIASRQIMEKLLPKYINTYGAFDAVNTRPSDKTISPEEFTKSQYKVPNKEQYRALGLKAYTEGTPTNLISDYYVDEESKYIVKDTLLNHTNKIIGTKGTASLNVEEPLSSIMITGATTKEALKQLVNAQKQLSDSFRRNHKLYSVQVGDNFQDLSTYLEQTYGIPSLDSRYIDWGAGKTDARYATKSDRLTGQKTILDIHLTPLALKDASPALKEAIKAGSLKILGVNPRENVDTKKRQISSIMLNAYKTIANDNSAMAIDNATDFGEVYFNNIPEGRAFSDLNLYTRRAGDHVKFDLRGDEYGVMTTTKSSESSNNDLMNVNFHLTRVKNNKTEVQAINNNTGEKTWRPLAGIEKDPQWDKVFYESPEDMTKVMGATLLEADSRKEQAQSTTTGTFVGNPYLDVLNTSRGPGIQTKTAKSTVATTKKMYPNTQTITIDNQTFQSRVPRQDLVGLKEISGNLNSVIYPYVHKAVKPKVVNLVQEYGVTISGTFRDDKNTNASNSVEDSMHKYGAGIDLKINEASNNAITTISRDKALMNHYGIERIIKESDHYHVEFKIF
jgi:hypothetical protein